MSYDLTKSHEEVMKHFMKQLQEEPELIAATLDIISFFKELCLKMHNAEGNFNAIQNPNDYPELYDFWHNQGFKDELLESEEAANLIKEALSKAQGNSCCRGGNCKNG